MRVAVPGEVKNHEYRVALTPAGAHELTARGHDVYVQSGAGSGSSISDQQYIDAGAKVLDTAEDVWASGELVLKVKEPVATEFGFLRADQILFTYLHLAADGALTEALLAAGTTAVAYETVTSQSGGLPLLAPMSEVAGRNAAFVACGMGADVEILDTNPERLRFIDVAFQGRVRTLTSTAYSIREAVVSADLVIGAVLVPGAKAPTLVSNDVVARMRPGSVLVDIAIDQGGCFADSRPTTHDEPPYQVHDTVFYCVTNMPGAVPRTSTHALTNATLPYVCALADQGWKAAVSANPGLAAGLTTHGGRLTNESVARAHGLSATLN